MDVETEMAILRRWPKRWSSTAPTSGVPSRCPAWRTHLRSVSAFIPSRAEIAFIATHSMSQSSRGSRENRTALALVYQSYLLAIAPPYFPTKGA
jgi:hypothetical protein